MPVKLENGIKPITERKCSVLPLRLHDTVTKSQRTLTCCYLSKFIQVYPCAIPSDTLTNMAPKTLWPKKSKEDSTKINFQWSDDEIELLLAVVNEYKTGKEANGLDWESIKTKYDDITTLFLSRYPKNQDAEDKREFKHKNPSQEFSKERIVAKIKALRLKYRKALDTGRRSGGGRVVAQFYDICSHIWSGSRAAEAIQGGIDTSSTASANTSTEANSTDDIQPLDENDESDSAQSQPEYQESSKRHRRDLVRHLEDSRNAKLNKKIPVDKQMLDITKKDFELKKEMMDHMKHMGTEHNKQMKNLSESMVCLTNALTAVISGQHRSTHFQPTVQPGVMHNSQNEILSQAGVISFMQ